MAESTSVALGPGTMTLHVKSDTAGQPVDFACEVANASITHTYADVGEAKTMLCGHSKGTSRARTDGFTASLENDLTDTGLYNLLIEHDMKVAELVYTPSTEAGASWAGDVTLALPATIGADKFGAPIVSDIQFTSPGKFTFTPAPAPAAPAAP
jgi:hypothetical protein